MVILLHGPDTYRSSRRARQLRQAFIDKFDKKHLAVQSLDGATVTGEMIVSAIGAGGLFSTKRLVVIDDVSLTSPCWSYPKLIASLEAVVADADRIIVLRLVPSAVAKKGRPVKAAIPKIKGIKEEAFPVLNDSELRSWLTKELKERKGAITHDAQEQLLFRTKNDLWRLDQELEKLLAASTGPITIDLVRSLVTGDVQSDIFSLTDALGQQQRNRALHLVSTELQSGTHPLVLVAAITRHLQTLWHVRRALDAGTTPSPTELELHPFVVKKATVQARTLSAELLHVWHHAMLEVERDLKTSPLDAETLVDRFVMRVPL